MSIDQVISKTQNVLASELRGIVNITTVRRLPDGWEVRVEVMEKQRNWSNRRLTPGYNYYSVRLDDNLAIVEYHRTEAKAGGEAAAPVEAAPPLEVAAPVEAARDLTLPDRIEITTKVAATDQDQGVEAVLNLPPLGGEESDPLANWADSVPAIPEAVPEVGPMVAAERLSPVTVTVDNEGSQIAVTNRNEDYQAGPELSPEPVRLPQADDLAVEPAQNQRVPAAADAGQPALTPCSDEEKTILALLRQNSQGLTPAEVRNSTGYRLTRISLSLRHLVDRGLVRVQAGKYTVAG